LFFSSVAFALICWPNPENPVEKNKDNVINIETVVLYIDLWLIINN
jgi:hypothetical protein